MTQSAIVKERQDGVLTIWLNRPEKLNALTSPMYQEIGDAVIQAGADPECRVIMLAGKGRAFSSGFDLEQEVAGRAHAQKLYLLARVANRARWAIWDCDKPVIAAVHGYCLGGAFELMLPCDFTIASEDCQLGEPEIQFGAGPAFMMVPWMTGHKRAKDVLLTGRRLTAAEACDAGFVTTVVAADELMSTARALAETLVAMPMAALQMTKAGINRAYEAAGMRTHLQSWTESTAYLSYVVKEAGSVFQQIVETQGTAAALEWRRQTFRHLYGSKRKD